MIYLDNAATTKTAPEVVEAMLPFFSEYYGNASSIYSLGAESKKAVNAGRGQQKSPEPGQEDSGGLSGGKTGGNLFYRRWLRGGQLGSESGGGGL